MGFEGFEEREEEIIAYITEEEFIETEFLNLQKTFDFNFKLNIIFPKNWNAEWESNFEPIVINNFVHIRANFHKPNPVIAHEIIITPKMSFGTGHHATTRLMLRHMQYVNFLEKTVFDFGTGTGILSIMSEKLGARSILAIDIDDWSIENASENIYANGSKNITVNKDPYFPSNRNFDIILANIDKNTILQNVHNIKKAANPGGVILLSGILLSDKQEIVDLLEVLELINIQITMEDKWICIQINV